MNKNKKNNKSGFTLIEVIVSGVILLIGVTGTLMMASSFVPKTKDSGEEIAASFIAKQILDDLRTKITPGQWATGGSLELGSHPAVYSTTINGVTYTAGYDVQPDPTGSGARKVVMTIDWTP